MTDVPPELQPYYQKETAGARARRIALIIVPILVVFLLIGGAIWGLVWLNHHKPATPHPNSNSQVAQNNQPQPSNNSSQGGQNSNGTNGSSSNQNSSQSQPESSGGPSSTNTSGSSGAQNSSNGAIPSTGPDASALALAAVATVGGATVYHVRQLRRVRRES